MRTILPMLLAATLVVSGPASQSPGEAPAPGGGHATAYDSNKGLALSAGPNGLLILDGAMHKGNVAITWLWQGGHWQRSDAAAPAPQRVSHAMAYDTRRKRVVMFGGHAGFMPGRSGEMFGDTWEFTGTARERVHPG